MVVDFGVLRDGEWKLEDFGRGTRRIFRGGSRFWDFPERRVEIAGF